MAVSVFEDDAPGSLELTCCVFDDSIIKIERTRSVQISCYTVLSCNLRSCGLTALQVHHLLTIAPLMNRGDIDFLNAEQMHLDVTIPGFVFKFTNDLQNVVVDKIAIAAINSKNGIFRNLIESILKFHLI